MHARKLASGTILRGEYVLLGVIGEEGSTVFRAHHRRDNHLVAVRIQQIDPAAISAHALDVPNAALRVRDPLLASVEASGQLKEGFLFVVSEYVSGQRMDQWADKVGIPPLSAVIDLVQTLSRALSRAHREGIAHGAINPRNLVILRSDSGSNPGLKTKLLDLGVPAAMRPRPPRLRSAWFMAPEQLAALLRTDAGVADESDSRMDVYGFGSLLYHLCTGGPPFQGRSIGELIAAHTADKLLLPSRINPRIPAALEAVILCALANDPLERYANGAELADALAEIRHTSGVSSVTARTSSPRARESPVDLSGIFSGFELDERPTSEIPIVEIASNADTARPPANTAASAADQELPSSAQPAPPVSRPPVAEAAASAPAPRASSAGRQAVPPAMMPPAAARTGSARPLVPPSAAIPSEWRRDPGPAAVPAGSFSDAPPAQNSSQRSTQRLSDPFAPHPRPVPMPPPLSSVPTHASLQDAPEPHSEDEQPAPRPLLARLARITQLDRRWLGVPFACLVLLIAYFATRPPPGADSRVGASEPQAVRALGRPVPSPTPQSANGLAPAQPSAPRAAPHDTARALPKVETRGESRARARVTTSGPRTSAPRSAPKAAKAPLAPASWPSRRSDEPLASEQRPSPPPSPPEPSLEPVATAATETPGIPAVRAAEPVAEPLLRAGKDNEAAASEPVLRIKRSEAPRPEPLAAATEIRELNVRGSLATSDVRRAIERLRAQFAQCYESLARAAGRNTFGEVAVQVAIDERGRAGKSNAAGSPLPGLNACVAQAMGRLVSTQRPDTGTVQATFKLAFVRATP